MHKIIVSVIVTTYNSSDTIIRTLDSIIEQMSENDELLIYDDFSKDDTVLKIQKYFKDNSQNYKLYIGIYNHGGPAAGRNWGINNAKGKYICFCDADDEWLADKLITQVNFLDNNKYDLCGTLCVVIGAKQYPITTGKISIISQLIRNKFILSTLMFNRNCFNSSNLYFDERPDYYGVEDYELILKLYHNGYKGFVINSISVKYYHTLTSLSHNDIKKSELKRILVLKNFRTKNMFMFLFIHFYIYLLKTRILYNEFRDYFC